MSQASRLHQLHPSLGGDIRINQQILSQRYSGSFFLRLKRPSRLPAYSRQYIKGDPVNLIDWKAFARNDQLIVREERDEASSRIAIIIDANDTMVWPSQKDEGDTPSKWELSLRMAMHIAFVHLKQGDHVKVYLWRGADSHPRESLVMSGSQDILSLFQSFQGEGFDTRKVLEHFAKDDFRPEAMNLSYLLSDMLRDGPVQWLEDLVQVRLFHTMSSKEVDLDWLDRGFCYFDESSGKKEFLGSQLQQESIYQKALDKWFKKLKKTYSKLGRDYHLFTDQTPIQEYLTELSRPLMEG